MICWGRRRLRRHEIRMRAKIGDVCCRFVEGSFDSCQPLSGSLEGYDASKNIAR